MIPDFSQFCGHPDSITGDVAIGSGTFDDGHDNTWSIVQLTGSPRATTWETLAAAIDDLPAGFPAIVGIDSGGGDLRGLAHVRRAIADAAARNVLLFAYVDGQALGASFVAAMSFALTWASPTARLGGIAGRIPAATEAVEAVRRLLARSDAEQDCQTDRSRLLDRLAAGHTFGGEEGEMLGVCFLSTEVERCVVPVHSGLRSEFDV